MNTNKNTGLNNKEVLESRKKHGSNTISIKNRNTFFRIVIESLNDPIIKILLIALAIKVLFLFKDSNLYETLGIAVSVFLACFISSISEYGSEKAFEKLSEENSNIKVKVLRNSKLTIIDIKDIVVGDVVYLSSGDRIPADGIIIEGNIYIDESILTGETIEKIKTVNDQVYMGSIVCENNGIIKVNSVGDKTYYGKIASLIQDNTGNSPLKDKLTDLAKLISKIGYIGAFLVFVSYMLNAVVFKYGISKMTNSLTEGKLKMISFITPSLTIYNNQNDLKKSNNYEIIYQSLIYNNDAFYTNNKVEGGNTTDRSIIEFMKTDDKSKYKILSKEPFNSKLKYSKVTTNYNNKTTFIKGAYEIIMNKCNYYYDDFGNKRVLINKDRIISYIKNETSKGIRVLCVSNDNILIGFILLKDNIRKEAYDGIKEITESGVQVVMVTGDAKETAECIAKELNIINNDNDIVLTSEEFNKMSDYEVKNMLRNLKVLSRSLPNDKNRLVSLANELNLVTGMTGDGVNDAPALKKANVGFSMGSGTEIAKETSDIVILDDNIKSISTAILYGRTIFKSIRKFITFQLSVNCCTVLLSIIGPFIGILSPITVVQVLWVNMVMDTFAGLAFSFEPAIKEYMKEKPKSKNEKIINSYMKNQIFCNGIFSMLLCIWFLKSNFISSIYRYDINNKYIMTAFFGLFIFIDIFNAFCSRTYRINTFSNILKNKVFILIFIFITIVQVFLIYYGGEIFRTTGLTIYEFEIMLFVSFLIIPFDMLRKIILKRKRVNMGF